MSACVYSSSQEDDKPSEDAYLNDVRQELQKHKLDKLEEKEVIKNFGKKDHPLSFLIVCNKLLTGFDAPIEAVMYLDNPLKEHVVLHEICHLRHRNHSKEFWQTISSLMPDYELRKKWLTSINPLFKL